MKLARHDDGRRDYACDGCGLLASARRAPMRWRLREGRHLCPACWAHEPAERTTVYRYRVLHPVLPDGYWDQQRAAHVLWGGLCALSDATLAAAQALRARYAPAEVAAADAQRERARTARQAAEVARTAWRASRHDGRGRSDADRDAEQTRLHEAAISAKRAAQEEDRKFAAAYATAKQAARAAGCDEKPLWTALAVEQAAAPLWRYRATTDAEGRRCVEVMRDGTADATPEAQPRWRLQRGTADQIVEEYRTAWRAWISHRHDGRGMPRTGGQAIGDRVRSVLRYTNGMDTNRLDAGTGLLTLQPRLGVRRGRRLADLIMAVGCHEPMRALVVLDRPLPDTADAIRRVELVGKRAAWDRWDWWLCVTVREPLRRLEAPDDRADAVAVDLRWRQVTGPAGGPLLQVAHYLDTAGDSGMVVVDPAQTCTRQTQRGDRPRLPSSWDDYALLQVDIADDVTRTKAMVWGDHHGVNILDSA